MGFQKSYVIFRVGHGKSLRLITRWVGGVKKGPKHAYVIFEWSLRQLLNSLERIQNLDYYTLPWMTLYVLNNHTAYLFIIYHHFDVFWRHTGTRHLTRALTNWIDQKFTGHIRYFLTNLVFRTLR